MSLVQFVMNRSKVVKEETDKFKEQIFEVLENSKCIWKMQNVIVIMFGGVSEAHILQGK